MLFPGRYSQTYAPAARSATRAWPALAPARVRVRVREPRLLAPTCKSQTPLQNGGTRQRTQAEASAWAHGPAWPNRTRTDTLAPKDAPSARSTLQLICARIACRYFYDDAGTVSWSLPAGCTATPAPLDGAVPDDAKLSALLHSSTKDRAKVRGIVRTKFANFRRKAARPS